MNNKKPTQEDRVVQWVSVVIGAALIFLLSWTGLAMLLGHAWAVQALGLAILITLSGLAFEAARQASK